MFKKISFFSFLIILILGFNIKNSLASTIPITSNMDGYFDMSAISGIYPQNAGINIMDYDYTQTMQSFIVNSPGLCDWSNGIPADAYQLKTSLGYVANFTQTILPDVWIPLSMQSAPSSPYFDSTDWMTVTLNQKYYSCFPNGLQYGALRLQGGYFSPDYFNSTSPIKDLNNYIISQNVLKLPSSTATLFLASVGNILSDKGFLGFVIAILGLIIFFYVAKKIIELFY